ncbi:MAG: hypothetical protein QXT45_00770 [Candidatus Bilamarchaeaceae archaeon]
MKEYFRRSIFVEELPELPAAFHLPLPAEIPSSTPSPTAALAELSQLSNFLRSLESKGIK